MKKDRTTRIRLRLSELPGRITPAGLATLSSVSEFGLQAQTGGGLSSQGQNRPFGGNQYVPASYEDHANRQVTPDGRFVVFESDANNLVPGQIDENRVRDVFVFDRQLNQTFLVSTAANATLVTGNSESYSPTISSDGRYVAFTSYATNLVPNFVQGDTDGVPTSHVFLTDRATSTVTLVSHVPSNPNKGGGRVSYGPLVSGDGQFVAFRSEARDLLGSQVVASGELTYLFSTVTGNINLVDHQYNSSVKSGSFLSQLSNISQDGRYIIYDSAGATIVAGTPQHYQQQIYLYDRTSDANVLVSHGMAGATDVGNQNSCDAYSSPDGRFVTFASGATNLVPGYMVPAGAINVYVYDHASGSVELVSAAAGLVNVGSNGKCELPTISADGRYVSFASTATDLIANFGNGNGAGADIFHVDRWTGTVTLVSRSTGTTTKGGNAYSTRPLLSGDGKSVAFASRSTDLVPGFVDQNGLVPMPANDLDFTGQDLFVWSSGSGAIDLVSGANGSKTLGGNGLSNWPAMSVDGNVIVYSSFANDQVAGLVDTNGTSDVLVWNRDTEQRDVASRRFGAPSNSPGGETVWANASADGRYIAYASKGANVVAGQVDGNEAFDVFVHDHQTGVTQLVSHAYDSMVAAAEGASSMPMISSDGRFVTYTSKAGNLVAGFVDRNGPGQNNYTGGDVFLYDRLTGEDMLVSRQAGTTSVGGKYHSGSLENYLYFIPAISGDGRYVAYHSAATDLVPGFIDANTTDLGGFHFHDLFVFDRVTGTNTLISHVVDSAVTTSNGTSDSPSMSEDGRYITYTSTSSNLITGLTGGRAVYVYDQATGSSILVSHQAGQPTTAANGGSNQATITPDSKYIMFVSAANNLVAGSVDPNNSNDIFLYERATGIITLASRTYSSPTTAGNYPSEHGRVSADGRYVSFSSDATDLVPGFLDQNGTGSGIFEDAYVFDRVTGIVTLVSRSATNPNMGGLSLSYNEYISADGRYVGFTSRGSDFVNGLTSTPTTGVVYNLFLFDQKTQTTQAVTRSVFDANRLGNGVSRFMTTLSHSGVPVFLSNADNISANDSNSFADVFAYVTPPPRVTSVQINDGSAQRSTIRSMTITLDDYVFVDGSPVSIVSGQGQAVGGVQWAVNYVNNSTVMTVTFNGANTEFGSLADGNYILSLNASNILGVGQLDGNGDGVGGDNYTFTFHRLFGDANGDGKVSATDFASFIGAYNQPGLAFDFNNDGVVTASDFNQFRVRYGVTI